MFQVGAQNFQPRMGKAWRRCRMADGACICDHPNFSESEDEYICDDEAQDGCFFFEERERDCD